MKQNLKVIFIFNAKLIINIDNEIKTEIEENIGFDKKRLV